MTVQHSWRPLEAAPDSVGSAGSAVHVGLVLTRVGQIMAVPAAESLATVEDRDASAAAWAQKPGAFTAEVTACPVEVDRVARFLAHLVFPPMSVDKDHAVVLDLYLDDAGHFTHAGPVAGEPAARGQQAFALPIPHIDLPHVVSGVFRVVVPTSAAAGSAHSR